MRVLYAYYIFINRGREGRCVALVYNQVVGEVETCTVNPACDVEYYVNVFTLTVL